MPHEIKKALFVAEPEGNVNEKDFVPCFGGNFHVFAGFMRKIQS